MIFKNRGTHGTGLSVPDKTDERFGREVRVTPGPVEARPHANIQTPARHSNVNHYSLMVKKPCKCNEGVQ